MSSAEPPLGAGPRAQPAWKREILERKRAKLAGAAGGEPEPPAGERLVVAESLGPLRENPFMRLESERRRLRQGLPGHGPGAARPLQQLLELYSAVPGIRTIRADNILIIESQPDAAACFAEGDALPGRRRDPAAAAASSSSSPPRRPDPLRELLARRGAALAEIRADQVVIYEAAEPPEPPEAAEPGTVSRLLEKFGQRPRGRRRRGGEAPTGPGPGAVPGGAAAPPQVGPGSPRAAPVAPPAVPGSPRAGPPPSPVGPGSPRASAPPHRGPGSPRASAPKAGPGFAQAGPASPQPLPAPPRAASPPAVPAAPQPAVLQPAHPRAAPPQPAAPQPLPAPPRAVTPQPTAPQAAPAPPRAAAPQAVSAAPKAAAPQANCFLHKIGSNSFTVTPRGLPPGSRVPEPGTVPAGRPAPPKGPPVPSASASRARANARRPKPEEAEAAESPLPSASLAPSATGSTQPLSASAPRAGGSFEIHPAPKPDLAAIPAHDLQAQALAKLRLNSRNSFLFVPRREGSPALPPAQSARPGPAPPSSEEKAPKEPLRASAPEQEEPVASPPAPLDPLVPVTYIDDIVEPDSGELSPRAGSAVRTGSLADQPGGAGDLEMEFSSVPLYRPHSAPPQRGGSTFTVVPKRKPVASGLQSLTDASGRPQREEEEEEEEESKGKGKAVDNADRPQVGMSHKKRYPTVNEIEVIGGYLSLERSCMSKTGSRRKKMKISFNETSLQTMFEYPSESSLAEEEEEEEGHASETEEDKSRTFYIPRPNSTLHPSTPNSDLSSYTPKHSVKFSEWQEQKYEEMPAAEGPLLKEADSHGNQVMLTPAEKGGLSDFSSEPALYF
ncbi:taperin isoform X2 [Aquila chrysaetos chrysaetos]|uniref:taperin isoform X2 n=1 Tax=Aquila chrysaetos chrysaetos TaxID=223781 RepID=UPI001176FAC5|nr:taperin isoform X2 [Aquila chrysaetos chrysaetos]